MAISLGTAIYIAVKPLSKIFLNGALGFILAKKNIFTVETCQKISLLIINFLLPCLIFYNVVNSLDGSEIKTIGSLAFSAFMFEAVGFGFGVIVRYTTPNPKRWFGGLLSAGMFNNSSDLPIAYVTTLAASPFFSADAQSQGIAYSVIFMVVFCVSLFNLGGFKLIAMDFAPKNHDVEKNIITTPIISRRRLASLGHVAKRTLLQNKDKNGISRVKTDESAHSAHTAHTADTTPTTNTADTEQQRREKEKEQHSAFYKKHVQLRASQMSASGSAASTTRLGGPIVRKRANSGASTSLRKIHTADYDNEEEVPEGQTETMDDIVRSYSEQPFADGEFAIDDAVEECSSNRTIAQAETSGAGDQSSTQHNIYETSDEDLRPKSKIDRIRNWFERHYMSYLFDFLMDFRRPQSLALIISMICTMIPPIRRLFLETDSASYIPDAPDGRPCLDFIMNFTSFVGAASVPLGLSMLGATIARLKFKNLPPGFWKSMVLMSLLKLVVLPIIAVAWTDKMRQMNWIDPNNKMAVFVIVVTAGVPTATSQLYITAMYTPPGEDHLETDCTAAYLICQYSMLLFTLTILVTYTLKNIVGM